MCHISCVTCHLSHVLCHMSCVPCHVSNVMCHMSCVTCHVSHSDADYVQFDGSQEVVGTGQAGSVTLEPEWGQVQSLKEEFWRVILQVPKAPQSDGKRRDCHPRDATENMAEEADDCKENLEEWRQCCLQYIQRRAGHIHKVGLDNINKKESSKEEIKEAVFYKNYLDIKADMKRYKKLLTSRSII